MDPKLTVRVCFIKKTSKQKEFGFNLASKSNDLCKCIGRVDFNSPAYLAGLRHGDRIVEINNKNVANLNYNQVIKLIKEGFRKENPDEVLLLVVDKNTDEHYKKISVAVQTDEHKIPVCYILNKLESNNKNIPIEFDSKTSSTRKQQDTNIEHLTFI